MDKTKIILDYNEKGGVGKTTVEGISSYLLEKKGYKILDVDLDPQHNLTDMIASTYQDGRLFHPAIELYKALENGDLKGNICKVTDNLDIAPSDVYLMRFQRWDNQIGEPDRYKVIYDNLKPFMSNYDFIFLDVPPTFNPFSLNALYACTDVALIIQTQKSSYTSAIDTIRIMGELVEKFHFNFNLVGVILYLMIRAKVDRDIARKSKKFFGKTVFHNEIRYQERVKGFTDFGISDNDMWDHRSLVMYNSLVNEMLKKIGVEK